MSLRKLFLFLLACAAFAFRGKVSPPELPHACFETGYNAPAWSFAPLDTAVKRCKIFFAGELHGVAVNPKLQFTLLRYLYDRANVRHLVIEYGPADAWLYQRYLDTGDETFLAGTWMYRWEEYVEFLRELRAFNASVEEKVDLVGVDFDSDLSVAKVLLALRPDSVDPPASLQPVLDSAKAVTERKRTNYTAAVFITQFKANFHAHEQEYLDYFGENFHQVWLMGENRSGFAQFRERDNQMARNFTLTDPDTARGYLCLFGQMHTLVNTTHSFSGKLNMSTDNVTQDFNGKVMSLVICYDSCEYFYRDKIAYMKAGDQFSFLGRKSSAKIADGLSRRAPCDVTLFDIRGTGNALYEVVEAHAPFIICVRNSKAVTLREQSP
jgi:hypothetical protein